jgi:hypothetical protein
MIGIRIKGKKRVKNRLMRKNILKNKLVMFLIKKNRLLLIFKKLINLILGLIKKLTRFFLIIFIFNNPQPLKMMK